MLYDGEKVETRRYEGRLRAVAWDRNSSYLIAVGNAGRILKIRGEEVTPLGAVSRHGLRAISVNPVDATMLIVGNSGTVILLDEDLRLTKLRSPSFENLRAIDWNSSGTTALIAGNRGILMKCVDGRIDLIDDGMANLRGISWRSSLDEALVTSNCFAEEFIPSPNLFSYDAKRNTLQSVSEGGRSDLIGVDWKPNGESALVVGYDVVWHNGFIGQYDGTTLSSIKFENKRVYPVAVRWDPSGTVAAIATATAQVGAGGGQISLWNGKEMRRIYSSNEFFFSHLTWAPAGYKLIGVAATEARAFDS